MFTRQIYIYIYQIPAYISLRFNSIFSSTYFFLADCGIKIHDNCEHSYLKPLGALRTFNNTKLFTLTAFVRLEFKRWRTATTTNGLR